MLVVQTAAEPPNHGRMHLLTINCIWKSKNALRNKVDAKSSVLAQVTLGFKMELAVWGRSAVVERKLLSETRSILVNRRPGNKFFGLHLCGECAGYDIQGASLRLLIDFGNVFAQNTDAHQGGAPDQRYDYFQ